MPKILPIAALAETSFGLALFFAPGPIGQLLFGAAPTGLGVPLARVIAITLVALGLACWPGPPRLGMIFYSMVVTAYLAYLGWVAGFAGALLWPAVAAHLVLTALLLTRD